MDGLVCPAGSHIMLEYGDQFGPWVAGSEGCELYGWVNGDQDAYSSDDGRWARFLAEHHAEMVPVPTPKRIPPWFKAKLAQGVTQWVDDQED